MRTLQTTAEPEDAGQTVRSVLHRRFSLPYGLLSHLKYEKDAVRRNGENARLIDRVSAGDTLTVSIRETGGKFPPVPLPLSVLYEDEDLLILNKPAGIAVHGSASGAPTLGNAVAAYLGADRPFHPVQRLDRDTSGVMCAAKNRYMHDRLRRLLHTEDFRREYLAVIIGEMPQANGTVTLPISRQADDLHRRFVTADGFPARTHYETLAVCGGLSLLRVRLETGRTHQIRVHFSHLGHPLLGDRLYGSDDPRFCRVALHAASLTLTHPLTGAVLQLNAPPPDDLLTLWKKTGLSL